MHCPFHFDERRSASLNVQTELWYCNTCDIGGSVSDLLVRLDNGEGSVASFSSNGRSAKAATAKPKGEVSEAKVRGYHASLLARPNELAALQARRGLSQKTIVDYQIGWDIDQDAYTIPVRDKIGDVVNIRFYKLDPGADRRKIWSVLGHGEPVLYPIGILDDSPEIIICEGEWDALLTIQNGFPAITRTGAAKVWKDSWNPHFEDKTVYLCHDMDVPGQLGNSKVQGALKDYAAEVKVVLLPYRVTEKAGKDLTDYWLSGFEPGDFKDILNDSEGVARDPEVVAKEQVDASVLDSYDANLAGSRMRMKVTIVGRGREPFLIPKAVEYTCSQDAGAQCQSCPMVGYGGQAHRYIDGHKPVVLSMMKSNEQQLETILRKYMEIPKCPKVEIEVKEQRSVEMLYVRSSIDRKEDAATADHITREVTSVGSHTATADRTVEMVGTIYPDPRTQTNVFQAWELIKTTTDFDHFEMTDNALALLLNFQPGPRGPVAKLKDIAENLSNGVTKIFGRHRMHALMDLVFHSALTFDFAGKPIKGWLDCLIIGDTRTGKSEAAGRLSDWYGAGEMVSCESASFAGVVGGVQQMSGKEWSITWGAIPLNDRQMVILDEISGLTVEQIAMMSSIRSSGMAEITKIHTDRTQARTRLLWMGNPRNARMESFPNGVRAIAPLIGNPEDIARFDLAMSVHNSEVDLSEINQKRLDVKSNYSRLACQTLLRWVWSRKHDQVKWEGGAEDAVHRAAIDMAKMFVEDPPLVQGEDVRNKIARLAVALAARTFSTDRTHENIVVTQEHVDGAVEIMTTLYKEPGFGYHDISMQRRKSKTDSFVKSDKSKQWLYEQNGLCKFVSQMHEGHFRRTDIEDMLGIDKESAQAMINTMWGLGLIRKERANIVVEPLLYQLVKELREMGEDE